MNRPLKPPDWSLAKKSDACSGGERETHERADQRTAGDAA